MKKPTFKSMSTVGCRESSKVSFRNQSLCSVNDQQSIKEGVKIGLLPCESVTGNEAGKHIIASKQSSGTSDEKLCMSVLIDA